MLLPCWLFTFKSICLALTEGAAGIGAYLQGDGLRGIQNFHMEWKGWDLTNVGDDTFSHPASVCPVTATAVAAAADDCAEGVGDGAKLGHGLRTCFRFLLTFLRRFVPGAIQDVPFEGSTTCESILRTGQCVSMSVDSKADQADQLSTKRLY